MFQALHLLVLNTICTKKGKKPYEPSVPTKLWTTGCVTCETWLASANLEKIAVRPVKKTRILGQVIQGVNSGDLQCKLLEKGAIDANPASRCLILLLLLGWHH